MRKVNVVMLVAQYPVNRGFEKYYGTSGRG
jgi:hypothetical protein